MIISNSFRVENAINSILFFVTGSVGLEVDTNSTLVRRKQEVEHNQRGDWVAVVSLCVVLGRLETKGNQIC